MWYYYIVVSHLFFSSSGNKGVDFVKKEDEILQKILEIEININEIFKEIVKIKNKNEEYNDKNWEYSRFYRK